MIVTGILFTYVIGTFVSWQWLAGICAIPSLICLTMLFFCPESPRYLIGKGKMEEALEALRWLRGADDSKLVMEEFDLVK